MGVTNAAKTPGRVVIIPCGGKKLDRPAAAGDMYLGSHHRACRAAADYLVRNGGRVLILSALYGLLELTDGIAPYEQVMGKPGAVDLDTLRRQAKRLGVDQAADVIVLGGRRYVDAAAAVWPHALRPFDGTKSMGEQIGRGYAIARGEYEIPTAAPAPAPRSAGGRPRRPGGAKPKQPIRGDAAVWDAARGKAVQLELPFADVVDELLTMWTRGEVTVSAEKTIDLPELTRRLGLPDHDQQAVRAWVNEPGPWTEAEAEELAGAWREDTTGTDEKGANA